MDHPALFNIPWDHLPLIALVFGWDDLIIAAVMLIASYAITALTSTKATSSEKPKSITDFEFPQTAEGTPQAVIFGDCWSPDHQILWYGNFKVEEIKSSSSKK